MSSITCPRCSVACRSDAFLCGSCGQSLIAVRIAASTERGKPSETAMRAVQAKDEMTVKGTAFLARRRTLESSVGSARVDAFINELAQKYRIFSEPILASTKIPATQWIDFNDALIERFYGGLSKTYWRFGQESAEFALTGPYKNLVQDRDAAAYAQAVGTAWKVYYSHGRAEGVWQGDLFRYCIDDVPVHHVYFEFTACGWVERGLQLIGASVKRTRAVQGYSRGDQRVEYCFHCDPPSAS
jgi:hypothetical protein